MSASPALADPAFDVDEAREAVSEEAKARLGSFLHERAEAQGPPVDEQVWSQANKGLRTAARRALFAEPEARAAAEALSDTWVRMDLDHDELFQKFRRGDLTAGVGARPVPVHWNPDELLHVRRPPYSYGYEDRPTPRGTPDKQITITDPASGVTNVVLEVLHDDAGVEGSALIGVLFRPQIFSGHAEFRPSVRWTAHWGLQSVGGASAHANAGFSMLVESFALKPAFSDFRREGVQPYTEIFRRETGGLLDRDIRTTNGAFNKYNGAVLSVPVTSQRLYIFWIESYAHVDASADPDFLFDLGPVSAGTAYVMSQYDQIEIQEFPGP